MNVSEIRRRRGVVVVAIDLGDFNTTSTHSSAEDLLVLPII